MSCVVGRNLNQEVDDEINGAMSRIGLLGSDTRFNVCMTRAKALLIVIGDPLALQFDNNFEHLLRHCVEKKAYLGAYSFAPLLIIGGQDLQAELSNPDPDPGPDPGPDT